ncbi:OmpA family protein [Aquirufa antheringensis]
MQKIILLVALFCGSLVAQGQDYSKLVEKKKYEKAIIKCQENLQKDPNNIESIYFSALIKSRQESGKYFSLIEAYHHYINALKIYRSIEDSKQLEKLEEIPINENTLKTLSDSIHTLAIKLAIIENKEQSFVDYISNFHNSPDALRLFAIKERNRISYEEANKQHSIESFNEFINKYPDAEHVSNAWENIYEIAFLAAKNDNSIISYQNFINKYPLAKQSIDANEIIHAIEFEIANNLNSISGYERFIDKYPNSKQIVSATNKLHELEYIETEKKDNSESYKIFIDKYPLSKQVKAAEKKYYLREFEEHTIKRDWESYKSFFENFEGPFKKVAIDSIVNFAKSGNLNSFQYLINSKIEIENKTLLADSVLKPLIIRGEYSELIDFFNKYNSCLTAERRLELVKEIEIANLALELKLDEPFNPKTKEKYITFIKKAGKNEQGFLALQRLISNELKNKKFSEAIKQIEALEINFSLNNKKIENLKKILRSKFDANITPLSIKEINTTANEYSPVISADNQSLFFCGNGRTDEDNYEHLYYSKYEIGKWGLPIEIKIGSDVELNNAPLANSSDGNNLFVFSDGDIFETNKNKSGWEEIKLMDEKINSESWEGDLTIASDNKTIIFSRGNAPLEKNIDIVFLVDATGSMGTCINGVKDNIYNFIDGLQNENETVNWRAKIINYRDFDISEEQPFNTNEFTNDLSILSTQLEFQPYGGGDEPESTLEAIYKTIKETKWIDKKNGSRVLITFTDATNKDWISDESRKKYKSINSGIVQNQLKNENIKMFLFAQNDSDYSLLESEFTEITLYDNAVAELQNADYSVIMNELSQKVSLISSNTKIFHGDRLPLSDLYISRKSENGDWMEAIKLSNKINTIYTERSPFLHPDMKTLYFSSDGHGGLGKLDVFVSKRLADSCWDCWSDPINLGKEINTPNSDWGYKISTDGEVAFFSKFNNNKNKEDIYKITLPSHLRPELVAKIEGEIKNAKNQPISTTIRWEDLENKTEIGIAKTDPLNGKYFIVLPLGKNYGYYIEDPAYFPISQNLDLRTTNNALSISMDIKVTSLQDMVNESISVPMNNLFFENAKFNLLPSSIQELKRITKLIANLNLKVEISGHTNDIGDEAPNKVLSEKRANAVKEFLIANGINDKMLISIGYGETKPTVPNDSESHRAQNRRVELKFIK